MTIDDQITQLRELAESKGETLYEIAFRNAGVGFVWHDEGKAGLEPQPENLHEYAHTMHLWTRKGLIVYCYYPTIAAAIEAETARLTQKETQS